MQRSRAIPGGRLAKRTLSNTASPRKRFGRGPCAAPMCVRAVKVKRSDSDREMSFLSRTRTRTRSCISSERRMWDGRNANTRFHSLRTCIWSRISCSFSSCQLDPYLIDVAALQSDARSVETFPPDTAARPRYRSRRTCIVCCVPSGRQGKTGSTLSDSVCLCLDNLI